MRNFHPSPRNKLIIAARRRGISGPMIAAALGMTHQRVHQIYSTYENQYGAIGVEAKRKKYHFGRVTLRCELCGGVTERPASEVDKRFCSPQCWSQSNKLIFAHDVALAISLRLKGETWRHISKLLKVEYQTVQRSIWYDLERRSLLTVDLANAIWSAATSKHAKAGRWDSVARHTGIAPLGDKRRDPGRRVSPPLYIRHRHPSIDSAYRCLT